MHIPLTYLGYRVAQTVAQDFVVLACHKLVLAKVSHPNGVNDRHHILASGRTAVMHVLVEIMLSISLYLVPVVIQRGLVHMVLLCCQLILVQELVFELVVHLVQVKNFLQVFLLDVLDGW